MRHEKPNKPPYKNLAVDCDRHGNVRYYVRVPGRPKVRIKAAPYGPDGDVTAAFREEYFAAIEGRVEAKPEPRHVKEGTFAWLINRYMASPHFAKLDAATQRDKRSVLLRFCNNVSDLPYRQYRREDVERSQTKRATTPGAANKLVKYLRAMFNWAISQKLADHNPALGVSYIDTGSEGIHTWTVEEIRQYEAYWPIGTRQRLALALALYTGARRADIVRLGPQFERDGVLSWIEHKGRNKVAKRTTIPIRPELREAIDATPTGALVYLVGERGEPYSVEGFGNEFRKWCRMAGLSNRSAHGLRKAAATILAERGATAPQLCAIFGWSKLEMAQRYIAKANREAMAADAMCLLDLPQADEKVVPLRPTISYTGTTKGENREKSIR